MVKGQLLSELQSISPWQKEMDSEAKKPQPIAVWTVSLAGSGTGWSWGRAVISGSKRPHGHWASCTEEARAQGSHAWECISGWAATHHRLPRLISPCPKAHEGHQQWALWCFPDYKHWIMAFCFLLSIRLLLVFPLGANTFAFGTALASAPLAV